MKRKLYKWLSGSKRLGQRTSLILLLMVVLASAGMIIMNYYTIRILSAARAYINGESEYSKGQKDASSHLINYIYLENEADYTAFEKDISVPAGDRVARVALYFKHNNAEARNGFLQAKNHGDDVDDMVWLFNNFSGLPLFSKAIGIWKDADFMVDKLYSLGLQSRQKIQSGNISADEKKSLIRSISKISEGLTIKEQDFSNTLGIICRSINVLVFAINIAVTLIVILGSLSYAGIMIRNLNKSKMKIIEQNESLQLINAGMDKFVFNITHDLRSPLAAMLGLIGLIEEETGPEQIKAYTLMMKDSLERQDRFIKEMLTFIKSKHLGLVKKVCSLNDIIDDVIAQNHFSESSIKFYKDVKLDGFESDALKLQVILNNLVSNAIKYSDAKKEERWVKINTYLEKNMAVIEVFDNGLGIRQKDQERIFDKFYQSGTNKRSSGMGLYIVKDAVSQMDGKIEIKSEEGQYSRFIVSVPC